MPKMYLMCGDIGSGKTTFAKTFANLHGFRYIGIDECYAFYNGNECDRSNKFEVWQLFFKLIHEAYKLNQDVVVDTNAPYISDRQEFLNWFPEYEEHTLIWISCSMEDAWTGNIKRVRKVPEDVFNRLWEAFEEPERSEPGGRSEWDNIYRINRTGNKFELAEIIKRNYNLPDYPIEKDFLFEILKKGMLDEIHV